ncbi:uncharacterized protein LODBEIA_P22760 [Lodderomyces beijingensis]|uniref:Eisosome protein 1 n=1 Tax=Lodderomyces beijingensis TaxID=1775926 RepID=A0ABP0ZIT5_9ASCO
MSHSVYQTSGKPLSKEALYHQRLRQGIFQSPSGTIVGVNSNASDTAALLAASSDLTVKPSYERSIAPEAHTAALAAKKQEHKDVKQIDQDLSDAASASKHSVNSQYTSNGTPYTTVRVGIPSALNKASIYKAAQQNSTHTMTSRIDPEKDIRRSGILSKQGKSALDINKVNKLATKNSSKSLNSRFNPDLDYRSGLKKNKPTEFLDQSEEDLAAESAEAALSKTPSVPDYATITRSSTFKAKDVVTPSLLAAAAARADKRLSALNSNTPQSLKQQAQLYANALAVAQQKSDERSKNRQAGVINLGGGLTITIAELDKLASTYVQPVIKDIETKADAKREIEASKKQRKLELKAAHEKAKQEEYAAKVKEKQEIEKAKTAREQENEKLKKAEDLKLTKHEKERNGEVDDKQKEYEELEKKHAEEKKQLLADKKQNQDEIDKEETAKKEERTKELKDLQDEKDEIIQPTLDELKEENAKLKEVTDARDELKKEVKAAEKQQKDYEAELQDLDEQYKKAESEIEKYTTDLEETTIKHEKTDKELADLKTKHEETTTSAEKEHRDLDAKIAELEKEKKEKTEEKGQKKSDILKALDLRAKEEHRINDELPPHLKRDLDDAKLKDTSSIFSEEVEPPTKKAEEPKATAKATTAGAETSKPAGGSHIKSVPLVAVADEKPTPKAAATAEPKTVVAEPKAAGTAAPKPVKKEAAKQATPSKQTNAGSAVKRPASTTAQQSPNKKRESFSKRFSNFFKDQSKAPAPQQKSTSSPAKAPAAKTPATAKKPEPAAAAKKEEPKLASAKKEESKPAATATAATAAASTAKKEEPKAATKEAKPVAKQEGKKTLDPKKAVEQAKEKAVATKSEKVPEASKQPAAKDAEKEAKTAGTSATKDSEDYADFDEELSLDKNGNKGGLFKEEILE